MARKKNSKKPTRSLGSRFKKDPVNTTVLTAKKLGIPKPVTKFILVATLAALIMPQTTPFINKIPGGSIFTGIGASLRSRLLSMR